MYDLGYIILQHSNTHFYKLSENIYFYLVIFNILFYIFSVGVGQNLVFSQKQFVCEKINSKLAQTAVLLF